MHGQKHLHISQNLPSNYPVIFSKKCELRDKIYKMQLALLFQFQIHTEKEKKKTKKLNGLLGLGRKTKSIQTIPMGDLSVCVCVCIC